MNILVTGANGQLGNEMRIVAKNSEQRRQLHFYRHSGTRHHQCRSSGKDGNGQ